MMIQKTDFDIKYLVKLDLVGKRAVTPKRRSALNKT